MRGVPERVARLSATLIFLRYLLGRAKLTQAPSLLAPFYFQAPKKEQALWRRRNGAAAA